MSLTPATPQPVLAWQFDSSNVDYISGLSPNLSTTGAYAAPSGGTITTVGSQRIHTFTSVGTTSITFLVPVTAQILVVAGGGGGGGNNSNFFAAGGGGGAGEVYYSASYAIPAGTYTVTVGGGGAGGVGGATSNGVKGSASVFGSISANGGGYGGTSGLDGSGGSGGSGGGGSRGNAGSASVLTAGGQGNAGGNSTGVAGAGGGGAGSVGANQTDTNTGTATGSAGGSGVAYSISGASVTYGAGGKGGDRINSNNGANGTTNRGNGGEGAGANGVSANGGSGGSGIVVISYNAALYPAPSYVTGVYKQAISFNNTLSASGADPNCYAIYDVSSFNLTSNSTSMSLWLNSGLTYPLSVSGAAPTYINLQGTNYNSLLTSSPNTDIYFRIGSRPTTVGTQTGQTGVWKHHCVVFSNVGAGTSNTITFYYVNGSLLGTANNTIQTFTSLNLACQSSAGNGALCSIDDVRLFNTALSSAQVQAIYQAQGIPGQNTLYSQSPQPSLAWSFDNTLSTYIGTISSTTQQGTLNYTAGKYNKALNIQNPGGTTSNSINWNFGSQTFSIDNGFSFSMWIRFNDLSYLVVIQQFITFYNGLNNPLRIQLNASQGLMQTQFTDSVSSKNVNMFVASSGIWYNIVLVGSAGNITLYLNGTTTYGPLAYVQSGITFNNVSLGLATSFNGFPVTNADFDDLRVYNMALNATQVQAIYKAQGVPSREVLSSSPLFSQLSSSAVASSVGAFSLRAVNGTTAKSIRVVRQSDLTQQDFWADRLGNLLTVPVTGQTLKNWLGGSTGNVVTWYDQSGKGNDATQATAANQPQIQKATKGQGYMLVFNASAYLTGFSYTVLNNTNYCICQVERRTASVGGPSSAFNDNPILSCGTNTNTVSAYLHNTYRNGTTYLNGQYSNDRSVTVSAFISASAEPIRYGYTMRSSTSGSRIYVYNDPLGAPITVSVPTQTTLLTMSGGNFLIGTVIFNGITTYYIGEIYEILVFTSSLYDLDGTTSINQIYQNQLSYTGT